MLFAARYPFVGRVADLPELASVSVEDIVTSPYLEEARKRGIERVMEAIDTSEISMPPLLGKSDRFAEIASYPYARILVSCVNDRYLTKRYALAESVRAKAYLEKEDIGGMQEISRELGMRTQIVDGNYMMHFTDYLRLASRIKGVEWKLINHDLDRGNVSLEKEKFVRLLQNALQDRIESELPLKVPDSLRKSISGDISAIEYILAERKSRFETKFSGELKPDHLPPCIRYLLASAQNGVNLPHAGRFALVSFLNNIGMGNEQILALFAVSPDFDESKSLYQINHITGESYGRDGYTAPECKTMKTNGICVEPDQLCDRDTMNHPLIYYRIKSGTGKRGE